MDRQIIYAGQIPLETDLLNTNRNVLIALGMLTQDIFGVATVASGLPCTPTSPGSMNVLVGAGRMYSLQPLDSTAYSALASDTADQVVKQGINLQSTQLSCPAPVTPGFAINYLIEGQYQDQDTTNVILPYYNASNPPSAWSGPNNTGVAQSTQRKGVAFLQAKAGIPALSGSQTTPAADVGFVPLWVVTVTFGQSVIVAGNISVAPGAPFITGGLLTIAAANLLYLQLTGGSLSGPLTGTSAAFASITVNGVNVQNAALFTGGSLLPAVVPLAAVTQYQTQLSISWPQITGVKNADQLNGEASSAGPAASTIAARDGAGQIFATYFVQSSGNNETPAVSQVLVTNGADGNHRKVSLSYFMGQMNLAAIGGQLVAGQVPAAAVLQYEPIMSLSAIGGQVANGQVPLGAVQQYQGLLSIGWGQITGTKNADQLQGLTATASATPSTIMARDSSGAVQAVTYFQNSGNNENPAVSQVMVTNGGDNQMRKASISWLLEQAMQSAAVTLQADPGGVPANGAPGSIVAYF